MPTQIKQGKPTIRKATRDVQKKKVTIEASQIRRKSETIGLLHHFGLALQ